MVVKVYRFKQYLYRAANIDYYGWQGLPKIRSLLQKAHLTLNVAVGQSIKRADLDSCKSTILAEKTIKMSKYIPFYTLLESPAVVMTKTSNGTCIIDN